MSSDRNRPGLGRNIVTNYLAQIVGVVLAFYLNPFIVESLGIARYGAWAFVAEIVVYASLLDLGAKAAVTHFVARYFATRAPDRARRMISTAFWLLFPVGLLASALGAAAAWTLTERLSRGQVDIVEMAVAMTIMSVLIGMNIPMGVITAGLIGRNRFDVFNGVDAGAKLLNAGMILALLSRGGGLVALALSQAASQVATWTMTFLALRREIPHLGFGRSTFDREEGRLLRGMGGRNFFINLARFLIDRIDVVVVTTLIGFEAAGFYQLGRILPNQLMFATQNISRAFTPRLTESHAGGATDETRRLFLAAARASTVFSMTTIACVVCFGHWFLLNWIGPEYVSGDWTMRSDVVLAILALAQVPRLALAASQSLIYASGDLRALMWIYFGEAAAKLTLSLALAPAFGLAGVAVGTLIPVSVVQLGLVPPHIAKRFGISIGAWLRRAILPGAAGAAALSVLSLAMIAWRRPDDWVVFLAETAVVGAAMAAIWIRFGLPAERRAALARSIRSRLGR